MSEKIDIETAEVEFQRFVDAMHLDVDTESMDADDAKSFRPLKKKIIKALCNGSLVINEQGEPIYTPVNSDNNEPIQFYKMDGSQLMTPSSNGSDQNQMKKLFSIMQSITKKPTGYFSKLAVNPDVKICMAITTLFLAE